MLKIMIYIISIIMYSNYLYSNNIDYDKITNYSHGGSYTNFDKIILEENVLYSASKYALDIFSIENDENILTSSIPFEGEISSIHKFENIIMLQVGSKSQYSNIQNRFYQIDVSDSYNPQIITFFTETITKSRKITGLYNDKFVYHNRDLDNEYVVGLTFVDPFTFERTTIDMNGYTYYLKDNLFMIQNSEDSSINDVYDFTDINNIEHVTTIPTPQGYNGICTVKPASENILVWLGFTSIILYDMSDIYNVQEAGHYDSDLASTFRFSFQLIEDKLIVGVASMGIEILDISDLTNPNLIEYYTIFNWGTIVKNGNTIYFAGEFEISVLELEDDSLNQVDSITTEIQYRDESIITNGYQYCIGMYKGLYRYNLENPDFPVLEDCLFPEDFVTTIQTKEDKLFVTHYSEEVEEGNLTILDISEPYSPEVIFESYLANATAYSEFGEDGKYYCISSYPSILQKFSFDEDISLEYSIPITTGIGYLIDGDYLYIAEYENSNQLSIYSGLSENLMNHENSIYFSIENGFRIYKVGEYLATSSQFYEGYKFFSLDDPISPNLEFELNIESKGKAEIKDDVLFVDAFYTLYMYDLTTMDFQNPEPISDINLESMYCSVQFSDDNFYVIQRETLSSYQYNITVDNTENEIEPVASKLTNYPNPFNPSGAGRSPTTQISFSLQENTQEAFIEIYNIKGQNIVTLSVEEGLKENNLTWDGTDSSGKSVSSGVYLYKLVGDGKTIASSKMMVVK